MLNKLKKQLQRGVEAADVKVDMSMPVIKEAGAKWLTALHDKMKNEKEIIVNGFKNVGIVEALKKARDLEDQDVSDFNPFAD